MEILLRVPETDDGSEAVYAYSCSGEYLGHAIGHLEGRDAVLETIFVKKHYEHQGVGRELFGMFVTLMREVGAMNLVGEFRPETGRQRAAASFYKSMGVDIEGDTLKMNL